MKNLGFRNRDEDLVAKNDVQGLVQFPESSVLDVSAMMNIPTTADVSAFLIKAETHDKNLIKLHGYDNSGSNNELVITPMAGFGPHYDAKLVQMALGPNDNPTPYVIVLNADDDEQGSIVIPADCNTFDLSYYCTTVSDLISQYSTNDGIFPFNLSNTPISDLINSSSYVGSSVKINNVSVTAYRIKNIAFGKSYNSVTGTGDYFLGYLSGVTSVNLNGLKNVTDIGAAFLYNCTALASIDLSPFAKVESIGDSFLGYATALTSVDLSHFMNLTNVGTGFMTGLKANNFNAIQIGNVDWSTITVGSNFFPNVNAGTSGTIYADSQELANKFKAKQSRLNLWNVVIN
jgi:hypothetical protein